MWDGLGGGQVREWSWKQESNEAVVMDSFYLPFQVHSLSFFNLHCAPGVWLLQTIYIGYLYPLIYD